MLTFTGHAGFKYETSRSVVLMDPWMSRYGAFDQSWYQFPPNHEFGDNIKELIETTDKEVFIYISHEHKDHFDIPYLETLAQEKITYLTPNFRRDHVVHKLKELKPKEVVALNDGEKYSVGGIDIYLFLDDNELNRDSGIALVDSESKTTFLNLNDCKIYDRIQEIIDLTGSIDVFSCQFSGAVFHPVCYNYPDKKYKEISESKVLGKFNSVKKIIETVNPSVYIPAAGPPVFLDRKLFHLNFEETNIFPSPFTFKDFLASKVEGVEIHVPVPGTEFVFKNNIEVNHPVDRIEDLFSDEVLNEYQDSMASYLDSRESSCKSYDPEQVFKLLFEELSEKLTDFKLTHEMKVLFSFSLNEIKDKAIYINFKNMEIEIRPISDDIDTESTYSISADTGDVGRLLDGYQNWDDFMLSFRHKLHRSPDIYQVAINGFLTMEKEDINVFCSNLMRLENQKERITVSAGGVDYSIDKYCPHQGSSLIESWIEDDRYLVCPKHRWKYDLENGGQAIDANATINAVDLDGDGS